MQLFILAYIPVLHRGYVEFIKRAVSKGATHLLLCGSDVIAQFPQLLKDIRAIEPVQMAAAIEACNLIMEVQIVHMSDLAVLQNEARRRFILPDEDEMHELHAHYLAEHDVTYDAAFLRWDKRRAEALQQVDCQTITTEGLERDIMHRAAEISQRSADWWRQVGTIVAKRGEVLMVGFNRHVPSPQQPYIDGDPRALFSRGVNIELSTALHAEAVIIAEAARRGAPLEGADLYVTDFPCPPCAKIVAYAGIRRLYFANGYSMLDGASIMRSNGVEIIRVQM